MQIVRDARQQPPPEHELERHVVPQQPSFGESHFCWHSVSELVTAPCSHPMVQLLRWKSAPEFTFKSAFVGKLWNVVHVSSLLRVLMFAA